MEEKQFKQLSEKLDKIIKLLAVLSVGDAKGREAIKKLSAAGFQPKDIAELIGTTPNTVRVALTSMKSKKLKKNAKKT